MKTTASGFGTPPTMKSQVEMDFSKLRLSFATLGLIILIMLGLTEIFDTMYFAVFRRASHTGIVNVTRVLPIYHTLWSAEYQVDFPTIYTAE
jgi:hypothetical protein